MLGRLLSNKEMTVLKEAPCYFSGCVHISGGRKVMKSFPMPSGIGFCPSTYVHQRICREDFNESREGSCNKQQNFYDFQLQQAA